jgi:NitT/TauT family transport system permease protein
LRQSRSDFDVLSLYIGIGLGGLALVAWELSARSSVSVRLLVSSPILIVAHIRDYTAQVLWSLVYTGLEATIGLALATTIGVSFGVLLLYWPRLARITYPWLVGSQIIPFVCLAPLVILIFGVGQTGKIFLSALMAFFPVLANLVAGIKSIPRPPLELMRMMNASRYMVARHVVVPFSLTHFFAGLRVAAPFSVIGAIVAEFNGADVGIGKDIFIAAKRLEPEVMMVGILSGAVLSALIYLVVLGLERCLGPWYWED